MAPGTAKKLWIVAIFAIAIALTVALVNYKPPAEIRDIPDAAPLVEVMELEAYDAAFSIRSQGTVRPRTETVLSAEISGAIVGISPKFVAGGVFGKGEELLRIDRTDYAAAVDRARALLAQRTIEYEGAEKLLSQGYRAESEYASAAAALAAARADLVSAERNLERTRISLPYDGMVRARDADLGQYVNPGTRLGVAFATDIAEVRLPLGDHDLAFIDLPDAAAVRNTGRAKGPAVLLTAIREGHPHSWPARIVRTEGVVDEKSRVTYAVAEIQDPYLLGHASPGSVPLPIGTFVAAQIDGRTVESVVRIPRSALRGNNQLIFVDEDDKLRIRNVGILRTDADYAYLRSGASPGERISLTTIESPLNGMQVRTEDADTTGTKRAAGAEPH